MRNLNIIAFSIVMAGILGLFVELFLTPLIKIIGEKRVKKIRTVIISIFILCLCGVFIRFFILDPIIKTAVKREDIKGNYIICIYDQVSSFEWLVIDSAEGIKKRGYCNIIGPDSWTKYSFPYEFSISDNLFIFYVEEKREYYSEETCEDMLEFVISDWDILYPVHHVNFWGWPKLFKSPKYLFESDLWIR